MRSCAPSPGTLDPLELRVVLRELLVREIAETLGQAGIPVMPLKGVLFAYWLYDRPQQRLGSDIDLLVPENCFSTALGILEGRGFEPLPSPSSYQRTLIPAAAGIAIDLHQTLFPRGYYRMPTAELFARGSENRNWFGTPVVVPDPYDAYAHLVGHEAAGHFRCLRGEARQDFIRLVERFNLDARRCAEHLQACGLARAARYTLGCLGPVDAFGDRVLAYLPRDPAGDRLAKLAHRLARKHDYTSRPALCSAYLTNISLPQTMGLLLWKAADRLRTGQMV